MKYNQMPIRTILLAAGILVVSVGGGCESEASSPAPPAQAAEPEIESPKPDPGGRSKAYQSKSYLGKARDRARDVIDDAEARSRHLAEHIDDPTAPMDAETNEEDDGKE